MSRLALPGVSQGSPRCPLGSTRIASVAVSCRKRFLASAQRQPLCPGHSLTPFPGRRGGLRVFASSQTNSGQTKAPLLAPLPQWAHRLAGAFVLVPFLAFGGGRHAIAQPIRPAAGAEAYQVASVRTNPLFETSASDLRSSHQVRAAAALAAAVAGYGFLRNGAGGAVGAAAGNGSFRSRVSAAATAEATVTAADEPPRALSAADRQRLFKLYDEIEDLKNRSDRVLQIARAIMAVLDGASELMAADGSLRLEAAALAAARGMGLEDPRGIADAAIEAYALTVEGRAASPEAAATAAAAVALAAKDATAEAAASVAADVELLPRLPPSAGGGGGLLAAPPRSPSPAAGGESAAAAWQARVSDTVVPAAAIPGASGGGGSAAVAAPPPPPPQDSSRVLPPKLAPPVLAPPAAASSNADLAAWAGKAVEAAAASKAPEPATAPAPAPPMPAAYGQAYDNPAAEALRPSFRPVRRVAQKRAARTFRAITPPSLPKPPERINPSFDVPEDSPSPEAYLAAADGRTADGRVNPSFAPANEVLVGDVAAAAPPPPPLVAAAATDESSRWYNPMSWLTQPGSAKEGEGEEERRRGGVVPNAATNPSFDQTLVADGEAGVAEPPATAVDVAEGLERMRTTAGVDSPAPAVMEVESPAAAAAEAVVGVLPAAAAEEDLATVDALAAEGGVNSSFAPPAVEAALPPPVWENPMSWFTQDTSRAEERSGGNPSFDASWAVVEAEGVVVEAAVTDVAATEPQTTAEAAAAMEAVVDAPVAVEATADMPTADDDLAKADGRTADGRVNPSFAVSSAVDLAAVSSAADMAADAAPAPPVWHNPMSWFTQRDSRKDEGRSSGGNPSFDASWAVDEAEGVVVVDASWAVVEAAVTNVAATEPQTAAAAEAAVVVVVDSPAAEVLADAPAPSAVIDTVGAPAVEAAIDSPAAAAGTTAVVAEQEQELVAVEAVALAAAGTAAAVVEEERPQSQSQAVSRVESVLQAADRQAASTGEERGVGAAAAASSAEWSEALTGGAAAGGGGGGGGFGPVERVAELLGVAMRTEEFAYPKYDALRNALADASAPSVAHKYDMLRSLLRSGRLEEAAAAAQQPHKYDLIYDLLQSVRTSGDPDAILAASDPRYDPVWSLLNLQAPTRGSVSKYDMVGTLLQAALAASPQPSKYDPLQALLRVQPVTGSFRYCVAEVLLHGGWQQPLESGLVDLPSWDPLSTLVGSAGLSRQPAEQASGGRRTISKYDMVGQTLEAFACLPEDLASGKWAAAQPADPLLGSRRRAAAPPSPRPPPSKYDMVSQALAAAAALPEELETGRWAASQGRELLLDTVNRSMDGGGWGVWRRLRGGGAAVLGAVNAVTSSVGNAVNKVMGMSQYEVSQYEVVPGVVVREEEPPARGPAVAAALEESPVVTAATMAAATMAAAAVEEPPVLAAAAVEEPPVLAAAAVEEPPVLAAAAALEEPPGVAAATVAAATMAAAAVEEPPVLAAAAVEEPPVLAAAAVEEPPVLAAAAVALEEPPTVWYAVKNKKTGRAAAAPVGKQRYRGIDLGPMKSSLVPAVLVEQQAALEAAESPRAEAAAGQLPAEPAEPPPPPPQAVVQRLDRGVIPPLRGVGRRGASPSQQGPAVSMPELPYVDNEALHAAIVESMQPGADLAAAASSSPLAAAAAAAAESAVEVQEPSELAFDLLAFMDMQGRKGGEPPSMEVLVDRFGGSFVQVATQLQALRRDAALMGRHEGAARLVRGATASRGDGRGLWSYLYDMPDAVRDAEVAMPALLQECRTLYPRVADLLATGDAGQAVSVLCTLCNLVPEGDHGGSGSS